MSGEPRGRRERLERPSGDNGLELVWPGKYGPDGRRAEPDRTVLQLVEQERFPGPDGSSPNLLVEADNLAVLPALLEAHAGTAALVYADPPFLTGDEFRMAGRASSRGRGRRDGSSPSEGPAAPHAAPGAAAPAAAARGSPPGVDASGREPADPFSSPPELAYADRRPGGLGGFAAMLAPRVALLRELLRHGGALYLHLDARTVHAAKLVCDEAFGQAGFRNHLVWVYGGRELARRRFNSKHDDILYYTNGPGGPFHPERILEPLLESSRRAMSRHVDDDGRAYVIRYVRGGGFAARDEPGRTYRQHVPAGTLPRDWFVVDYARKAERTGYPTQKPAALVERLLLASTEPGDLVIDPFVGSGTAAAVAAALGRRWIAVDASRTAVATTRRRLLAADGRGGGFVVAVPAGLSAAAGTLAVVAGARRRDDGLLEAGLFDSTDLDRVEAWAVGRLEPAGTFVAIASAVRSPWSGDLARVLAVGPTASPTSLVVRAWEASGAATTVALGSLPG